MLDGRPVGTGSLTPIRTVAWLGGASTLPEARGRGAQHALLVDRLHRAQRMGCTLAAVTAVPDGVSARNLLRVGFQLLYTQAVMTRGG
jgi:GNAT superfamily N-acetyltransferase